MSASVSFTSDLRFPFGRPDSRIPIPYFRPDGITAVSLPELLAMRARAGKPAPHGVRVRSAPAGAHVSALRGRGMDYAESRVYQPGDDVRNIDWRRTARSGKWHTKLFEAEREQAVLLLVDTHGTMRFGTRARYKSVAAACAAAWLAWTSVRAGDRIGALAFGGVRSAIDPHAGTRGALAVLGALVRWDALAAGAAGVDAESLSAALQRARQWVTPGSRIWLLSDGWCVDEAAVAALARLTQHADVRVAIIADALEHELVPAGSYRFETTGRTQVVDLSRPAARTRFRERLSQGWRRLADACDHAGVPWATVLTTDAPDVALAPLWRKRMQRR